MSEEQPPFPQDIHMGTTKLDSLRGSVRPLVTLGAVAMALGLAAWEAWNTGKTPDWFLGQLGTIVGFWFATREAHSGQ